MNKENTGNGQLDLERGIGEKANNIEPNKNKSGGGNITLTPENKVTAFFELRKETFMKILPAHLSVEKLKRYALISFKKVPKLLDCDVGSILFAFSPIPRSKSSCPFPVFSLFIIFSSIF